MSLGGTIDNVMFRIRHFLKQIRGRHIGWGIIGALMVHQSLRVARRYEWKPNIINPDSFFDWCWLSIYLIMLSLMAFVALVAGLYIVSTAMEKIQNHHKEWIEWISKQFDKLFGV